ncbi:MAG: RluA family pseudouridine synthase [Rhodovibrionaceae bacterium]
MDEAAAERHSIEAAEDDAGQRLDAFLAARLPALSRSRIKALIEAGCLTAGGAALTAPSRKIKAGEVFALSVPPATPPRLEGQAIPLAIVYEDESLIVIDKPAGLVVHPAAGNPDCTLVNALIAHCGPGLTGIGGEARPGIVHRLDKDTSGLLVAAKTAEAHAGLTAQFAARSISRLYEALVWGRPKPPDGEISGNIGRSPRNRKKMAVLGHGGREAATAYRSLAAYADGLVSRVECRLRTGRTHQIRVHMSHLGHPLLGDPLYGRKAPAALERLPQAAQQTIAGLGRQALHARTLGFQHPANGEILNFSSPLPPDLSRLIDNLESI